MKISIITVCLNSEDTIEDCLLSISQQTYHNIESVVIDGGSTDRTIEIIKSFSDIINIVLISESDLGIYDALNKGMEIASGDVVGILHSDDVFANPESVTTIADAFQKYPNFSCVHGDLLYVPRFQLEKTSRYWKSGKGSKWQFLLGWMPPHPTFYIRKEILQTVGGYRIDLGTAADYEFMLRVMLKYQFKSFYIPRVLVKMRLGGISNRNFKQRILANFQDRKAWKVNDLKCYFFTIPMKPVRKIPQFIMGKIRAKKQNKEAKRLHIKPPVVVSRL